MQLQKQLSYNIALSADDDKRMQLVDSMETCLWNKWRNNKDNYNKPIPKSINYDDDIKENINKHNKIGHEFLMIHTE